MSAPQDSTKATRRAGVPSSLFSAEILLQGLPSGPCSSSICKVDLTPERTNHHDIVAEGPEVQIKSVNKQYLRANPTSKGTEVQAPPETGASHDEHRVQQLIEQYQAGSTVYELLPPSTSAATWCAASCTTTASRCDVEGCRPSRSLTPPRPAPQALQPPNSLPTTASTNAPSPAPSASTDSPCAGLADTKPTNKRVVVSPECRRAARTGRRDAQHPQATSDNDG